MNRPPSQRRPSPPPRLARFRLRHLLGALAVLWGGSRAVQQARAAFELHTAAAAHANYALCMVGPTGPQLLREGSSDYFVLLGRRLVAADPEAQPFAGCAVAAEKVGLSRDLHEARASSFREYFDQPSSGRSVAELRFDRTQLDELTARAGLFAPGALEKLIIPERHAAEAPHPRELVRPALGNGLPARTSLYRSALSYGDSWVLEQGSGANAERAISHDRGLHWQAKSGRGENGPSGPCAAAPDGSGFSLIVSEANETVIVARSATGANRMTKFAARTERVLTADCDESGFLGLLTESSTQARRLRTCSLDGPCSDVPLPKLGERILSEEVDVAWVGGDIVLVVATGRLTRVTTSRDRGQSWTPWVLAFDGRESLSEHSGAAPRRLLHVGDDLLLYGVARRSEPYLVLISRDHGASFTADFDTSQASERLVNR